MIIMRMFILFEFTMIEGKLLYHSGDVHVVNSQLPVMNSAYFSDYGSLNAPIHVWDQYVEGGLLWLEQGKSEGFDSCDRPSNLTTIGFKPSMFQPMWPWNLTDDL